MRESPNPPPQPRGEGTCRHSSPVPGRIPRQEQNHKKKRRYSPFFIFDLALRVPPGAQQLDHRLGGGLEPVSAVRMTSSASAGRS